MSVNKIESLDHEPQEPFNRAKCIEYTLRTYTPQLHSPIGYNADSMELRFLNDEVISGEDDGRIKAFRMPVIDDYAEDFSSKLLNQAGALTAERIKLLIDAEKQRKNQMAPAIIERAEELGMVQTMSKEQAQAVIQRPFSINALFDPREFAIHGLQDQFQQTENGRFLLLKVEQNDQLKTVDIDQLFTENPDFVRNQIREYHRANAVLSIVGKIANNLELHDVERAKLIPPFMESLSEEKSTVDIEVQVMQMILFMRFMSEATDFERTGYNFYQKLKTTTVPIRTTPYSRVAEPKEYLEHHATCPANTEEDQIKNSRLLTIYEEVESGEPFVRAKAEESILPSPILEMPVHYAEEMLSDAAVRTQSEITRHQLFLSFIDATKGIERPEEVEQILAERLPGLHEKLQQFKNWMVEESRFGKRDGYSEMLENVVMWLSTSFSRKDRNDAANLIQRELYSPIDSAEDKEWVIKIDRHGNTPPTTILHDEDLRDIISILAVKKTQQELLAKPASIKTFQTQGLEDVLYGLNGIEHVRRNSVEKQKDHLVGVAWRKMEIDKMLEERGIPIEFINEALKLSLVKDSWGKIYPDTDAFTLFFNIMYLTSMGLLTPDSKAFQSFVKEKFNIENPNNWESFFEIAKRVKVKEDEN